MSKIIKSGLLIVLLTLVSQSTVLAHCDYTDCGRIVGNLFYSRNYPNGMQATSGNDGWVQMVPSGGSSTACYSKNYGSNQSTNTMTINGQAYWKYDHKYFCNMPIDDYAPFLLLGVLGIGFVGVRKLYLA